MLRKFCGPFSAFLGVLSSVSATTAVFTAILGPAALGDELLVTGSSPNIQCECRGNKNGDPCGPQTVSCTAATNCHLQCECYEPEFDYFICVNGE